MEIVVTEFKRASVVQPKGHIDGASAEELEATLGRLVHAGRANLVVDLSEVDFLSSAGLRTIVSALKKARKAGGDLRVASPNPRVAAVLRLAGVEIPSPVYGSREAAIASF